MSADQGAPHTGAAGFRKQPEQGRSEGLRAEEQSADHPLNLTQVRWYVEQLHTAAKGINGIVIPMAICPSTDRAGNLWSQHEHVAVGDVENMITLIVDWVGRGANVYVAWSVFGPDAPKASRGAANDVVKVLALIADRDADDAKAGVSIIDPTIEVISSQRPARNTNEVYVFDAPIEPEEAHTLGRGLRAAMHSDSGTGDIVRVTRIPGTPNFPNYKKIHERHRPREPQLVILGDGGTNARVGVQQLVEAIQTKTGRPIRDFAEAAGSKGSARRTRFEDFGIDEREARYLFEQLPHFIQQKIEHNDPSDRSEHVFNVAMLLMEQGLSDQQIAAVLLLHPAGAAEKYIARGDLGPEIARCRCRWRGKGARTRTEGHGREDGPKEGYGAEDGAAAVKPWPVMAEPAMYGITGDIARLATEHSEADPVGVAMTHLVWAGAAFGRTKHFLISDDLHHARLFTVLVGESSRARKGTSTAGVRKVWNAADSYLLGQSTRLSFPSNSPLKVLAGPMSTGEGIIMQIRDGDITLDSEDAQPGVPDKRLLIIEGEFGAVLKAAERHGNTLSAILRSAWDGRNLAPIVKHMPISATEPHLCVVGHITRTELNALLSSTDIWNGFVNRILWMAVRRNKIVHDPKPMREEDVNRVGKELARLTIHAHTKSERDGRVLMTNHAADYWAHIYPELTQDFPGIYGVVTARAEAQVLRIALTYALLEGADMIGEKHLEAALALWRYSTDSVKLIFADAEADPDANKLIAALGNGPMSQTDIGRLFAGHKDQKKLTALLRRLQDTGRIGCRTEGTRGRPMIMWFLR